MPKELELLKEWKERLGLYDWTIELMSNVNPDDLDEDADGDVEYIESTKCAVIKIVDPKLRKAALRKFDFELCLVHELLHCKLSLLMDGEDWEIGFQPRYLHQIVDDLARAFVAAKYDSKTKNTINYKDIIENEKSEKKAEEKTEGCWWETTGDDVAECKTCHMRYKIDMAQGLSACPFCDAEAQKNEKKEAVWVRDPKDPDIRVCSKCGWTMAVDGKKHGYCEGCGSKMTGCINGE